jgi:hypothetical protein
MSRNEAVLLPKQTFVLEGSVWVIEDMGCGYVGTCQAPKLVVASETIEGLIYAACDALGIGRVMLAPKDITKWDKHG